MKYSFTLENKYKALLSIAGYEGCILTKYKDHKDNWTIGYGHLIRKDETYEKLTFEQADELLEADFDKHMKLAKTIPGYEYMDTARRIAIINVVFNMGASKFIRKFPSCMNALRDKDYKEAAKQLLCGRLPSTPSQYLIDVGQRALDVAKLLETGDMNDLVMNKINYGYSGPRKIKSKWQKYLTDLDTKKKGNDTVMVSIPKVLWDNFFSHMENVKLIN